MINTLKHKVVDNKDINSIYSNQQLDLIFDDAFKAKLELAYNIFINPTGQINEELTPIPLEFGAAKNIIEYVSDDFDEPLTEEFREYL